MLYSCEHEGQAVAKVLDVAFVKRQPPLVERRLRRKDDVFDAVSLVVVKHIENFVKFPGHSIAVARLHFNVLPVSVVIARFLEQFFLGGKAGDDFLRRDACGLCVLERAFLGKQGERRQHQAGKKGNRRRNAEQPVHDPILSDNCRVHRGVEQAELPGEVRQKPRRPSPDPSPLSEAGVRALQFCRVAVLGIVRFLL